MTIEMCRGGGGCAHPPLPVRAVYVRTAWPCFGKMVEIYLTYTSSPFFVPAKTVPHEFQVVCPPLYTNTTHYTKTL